MLRCVLFAASSQQQRRTRISHSILWNNHMTRRSYIFLPASFSEFQQTMSQLWTQHREKRRAVLVQLLTKVHRRPPPSAASSPTSTWMPTLRSPLQSAPRRRYRKGGRNNNNNNRVVLLKSYYAATRLRARKLRARFIPRYNNGNNHTPTMDTTTSCNSTKQDHLSSSSSYTHSMTQWFYKKRRRAAAAYYRWIDIDEPMQRDWFDARGFPQASKNKFGRFVNPWNSESTNGMQSLLKFLKWRLERLWKTIQRGQIIVGGGQIVGGGMIATGNKNESTTSALFNQNDNNNTMRLTWIGHSTTLLQLPNFTILTDPHFSARASPYQVWGMGVARTVPPSMAVTDLPDTIHAVMLSHDHYDHLDIQTVRQLRDRVQVWAVPLGIKEWLVEVCRVHPERIVELTWWESVTLRLNDGTEEDVDAGTDAAVPKLQVCRSDERGQAAQPHDTTSKNTTTTTTTTTLTLTCAPAQHWCGRTMWDRNVRLWCSWALQSGHFKFYFAGDTGLPPTFPLHRQIGDRLGPFDLAALPIGAYEPRYFMRPSHVHPCEAVQIHQDIRAKKSVAIHWGTFPLADEDPSEAKRILEEATEEAGIDFVALPHGGAVEVHKEADNQVLERVPPAVEASLRMDDKMKQSESQQTRARTEREQSAHAEEHVEYG